MKTRLPKVKLGDKLYYCDEGYMKLLKVDKITSRLGFCFEHNFVFDRKIRLVRETTFFKIYGVLVKHRNIKLYIPDSNLDEIYQKNFKILAE